MSALAERPWLAPVDRLSEPHPAYAAALAALGSDNSRRSYAGYLRKAARLLCERHRVHADPECLPWHRMTRDSVLWLREAASVRDGASVANPAGVNAMLHAVRAVARECFALGMMSAGDHRRLMLVSPIRHSRLAAGRSLEPGELSRLVRSVEADATPLGVRDLAVFALLYSCGLRRAELAGLQLGNVEDDSIRVVGKGNRERRVYMAKGALRALERWTRLRGDAPGALFVRVRRGGHVDPALQPLTAQAIYDIVKRRSRNAGLSKPVAPHDFRRTLLTHLLEAGRDVFTVQAIAGHSDPSTTARYDRRGEDRKRAATADIHFPLGE